MTDENKKRGRPKKEKNYDSPFAVRLRELAGERTHQEIADGVGVSRQTIGQFLLGNTQPDLDTLGKLAGYFEVSTDYLLCRTNIKTPEASMQAICEYTGLNEQAVKKLHTIKTTTFTKPKRVFDSDHSFAEYRIPDPNVNSEFLCVINSILNDAYFDIVYQRIHALSLYDVDLDKEPTSEDERKAIFLLKDENIAILRNVNRYIVDGEFFYNMMKESIKSDFGEIINHIVDKDK